ncbi:hypothetical protein [Azohydromonas aeria]|uniref:hypothetical protein n=1 Tax=Azohydromonas aeria TaxID=2590212 RepID=UPI0012FA2573|nr:hypothetical protein [Azohydromonas aeria]
MDFFLGLVTGYMLNWAALAVLLLLAIFFEALECTGTALLVTAFTAFVAYLFFGVPLRIVLYGALAYAAVGVLWSIWRYRRYVHERVALIPDAKDHSYLAPKNQTRRIVHWMVVWPVSMASSVVGDVLVLAKTVVTKWLRGIYEAIYQGAVSSARKP